MIHYNSKSSNSSYSDSSCKPYSNNSFKNYSCASYGSKPTYAAEGTAQNCKAYSNS